MRTHTPSLPPLNPPEAQRLLIIKLGALGDFVLALAAMQTLRSAYPRAQIDLLTTKPFEALAQASGIFADIKTTDRPALWNLGALLDLRVKLRETLEAEPYDLVVDLQTSDRSSAYRLLTLPRPPLWSGIAPFCSHPHTNPNRDDMHTLERQADQLAWLGISETQPLSLSFLAKAACDISLPERAALLVPGGAPHRPDKRWPAENYAEIAGHLAGEGFVPVLIGTDAERPEAEVILKSCAGAVDLIGKTSILDLGVLAASAASTGGIAIGNDTGPMHLISASGCPSLVLYSHASDPALCAQRGPSVEILRHPSLRDLDVGVVHEAVKSLLASATTQP